MKAGSFWKGTVFNANDPPNFSEKDISRGLGLTCIACNNSATTNIYKNLSRDHMELILDYVVCDEHYNYKRPGILI